MGEKETREFCILRNSMIDSNSENKYNRASGEFYELKQHVFRKLPEKLEDVSERDVDYLVTLVNAWKNIPNSPNMIMLILMRTELLALKH